MPAYEYLCNDCGVRFDRRQKMSDAPLETCPACGGSVRRLISGGAGAITASSHSSASMPPCAAGGACCMGGGGCEPAACHQH